MSGDQHRWYRPTHQIAFWKDNVASVADKANCAVVEIAGGFPSWRFEWPGQRYEIEKLEGALHRAYECGKSDAKREIRDALGVMR